MAGSLHDARKLTAAISSLTRSPPDQALIELETWLTQLRACCPTIAPSLYPLFSLIDSAVREHYRDASRLFLQQRSTRTSDETDRLHCITERCLAQLAAAHLWSASPWAWVYDDRIPAGVAVGPVIMQAVRAASAVRKWSRLLQQDVRPGVWADLYQVYLIAEARHCTTDACPVEPGSAATTCVEREFLKACALACVDSGRLLPEQLDIAERIVEFCSEALRVSAEPAAHLSFAVDLDRASLPVRWRGTDSPSEARRYVGLDAKDRRLETLCRQIEAGRLNPVLLGHHRREVVTHMLGYVRARLSCG